MILWLLSDPATDIATVAFVVLVVVAVAVCRHASQHYVASAATGWRYTTWERMKAAEACLLDKQMTLEVDRAGFSEMSAQAETLELNEDGTYARRR